MEVNMSERTEQQQQELDREPQARFIDPRTKTTYVLVRIDVYDRLKAQIEEIEDEILREASLRASHESAVAWMKENPY
jgi:hypothetical protein